MNGNNYNKSSKISFDELRIPSRVEGKVQRSKMKNQKGQVLLITIMLLATVLTVTLAATFKSTTETQLTKQEEESQKALSAAEAGIELALQQGTVNIGLLPNFSGSGFTGQATVTSSSSTDFVTPLLQKDKQYTFYLATYSSTTGFSPPYYTSGLKFYFGSEGAGTCAARTTPALEVTLIYGASNSVKRWVIEPCSSGQTISGTTLTSSSSLPPQSFGGSNFYYLSDSSSANRVQIAPIVDPEILIVRALFAQTRIGLRGSSNLPTQGKYVNSEARSPGGVTKKVQLFQSGPQLPAEFFVTTF